MVVVLKSHYFEKVLKIRNKISAELMYVLKYVFLYKKPNGTLPWSINIHIPVPIREIVFSIV